VLRGRLGLFGEVCYLGVLGFREGRLGRGEGKGCWGLVG